jgi:hypothetical protein
MRGDVPHWASTRSRLNCPGVRCGISSCAWRAWNSTPRCCQLRRDREGRLFAAGLEITPDPATDEEFADWLLVQDSRHRTQCRHHLAGRLARAPPLELKHLNFQLDNSFGRHRFGLTADPPRQLAARIDIRGNFKGRDFDQLEAWKGEAYAELDYADLAVWRTGSIIRSTCRKAAGPAALAGICRQAVGDRHRRRPPGRRAPAVASATCRNWTWSGSKAASPGAAWRAASKRNSRT